MTLGRGKKTDDIDKYFNAARDWDQDRAANAHAQKRLAYLIGAGGVLFGLAMLGWHVTNPLRSVEPYVVRVDRTTGETNVITRLSNTRDVTTDEAVNKFFLADYVRQRESWVEPAALEMMRRALALSLPAEQARLYEERDPKNATAPMVVYGKDKSTAITIRSIIFINQRVAQVRYLRTITGVGISQPEVSSWTATINFKYLDRPVTEAARLDNPLGFQVVSYRADPEMVP
jgi:type IV secretion system protein VirB8